MIGSYVTDQLSPCDFNLLTSRAASAQIGLPKNVFILSRKVKNFSTLQPVSVRVNRHTRAGHHPTEWTLSGQWTAVTTDH